MNILNSLHIIVGLIGFLAALWINFFVTMPIIAYLLVMPLICLPSIMMILQGLTAKKASG